MDTQLPGISASSGSDPTLYSAQTAKNSDFAAGQFADYYRQQLDKEAQAAAARREAESKKAEKTAAEHQALATELGDYLKKSPAQHLRDSVMKELGISEEDLKAMPPEKRQAMEKEIARRMRERLASTEKQRGRPFEEMLQGHPVAASLTALDSGKQAAAVNAGNWSDFFNQLVASASNTPSARSS